MKKKCPKCRRKFDNRGYRNHFKKCSANPTQKSVKTRTEYGGNKIINEDGDTKSVTFSSKFPRVWGQDAVKVKDYLLAHPDQETTPHQIANSCDIKPENARQICLRFFKKGFIERPMRNQYVYRQNITAEELEYLQKSQNLTIHHIQIVVHNIHSDILGDSTNSVTHTKYTKCDNRDGETIEIHDFERNLLAEITILKYCEKAVFEVRCSETPLDFPHFLYVLGIIIGKGFDLTEAKITTIEANKDVPGVKISGTNCMQLKKFANGFQRLYNKGVKLREEIVLSGVNISLTEAIRALGSKPFGLESLLQEVKEVKMELKENNRVVGVSVEVNRGVIGRLDKLDRIESGIQQLPCKSKGTMIPVDKTEST